MREVPRVLRGRPGEIERGAADREFPGRELAEQDRARFRKQSGRHRILIRHMILEERGMPGRGDPLRVVDILERDGDAVKRPLVAALHDLGFAARAAFIASSGSTVI